MRRRVATGLFALTAALVAATAVATGGAGATPDAGARGAAHAPKPPERLLPLVGSSKVVVYAEGRGTTPLHAYNLDQFLVLHALTAKGHHLTLGQLGTDGQVSVVGSNIDITSAQDNESLVRWWDLADDKHGSFETSETCCTAAPNGWMYETAEGQTVHLGLLTYQGHRTDLGAALPPGVGYAAIAGSTGIVATADNDEDGDGKITFMYWAHPGVWKTLDSPNDSENFCGWPSSTDVVCQLDSGATAILPLGGAKPTTRMAKCAREPTAYKTTAVWISPISYAGCPKGRLGTMSKAGTVRFSTRRYSGESVIAALGRIVVATSDQGELVTLTGARATPKTLVRAH